MTENEQPLQLGDFHFAQMFLNSGVAMVVVAQDGKVAFSTKAAAQIFGLETTQITGCHIESLLPEAHLASWLALEASPTKDYLVQSTIGRHASGLAITLSIQVTSSQDTKDQQYFSVILRDISNELNIGQKTLDDLRLSGAAAKGARIGAFEYMPQTDEVIVSHMWRELLEIPTGGSAEVQSEWRSRIHPDDLELALAPIFDCQTEDDGIARCDYRFQSGDGKQWRWFRTTISLTERDDTGVVRRVTGAMVDVTDIKNGEIESQRNQAQFQSAFENATIGKALVGLDGSFLRVNKALCKYLGYSQEQLLRCDFQSLTHPDDLNADLALLNKLVARRIPSYSIEKRYIRQDGTIVWGLLSVSLIWKTDGQPDHAISQIVDITEQRRLAGLKKEFVATISHELRTPLTSVLGALSLLRTSKDDDLSDLALRFLDIAQQNGNLLKDLINDILDFEKYSSGLIKFELTEVKILGLIQKAILTNEPYAQKFGVKYEIDCKDDAITAFTEPKRFNQVVTNLLSNAAKFADQDSIINVKVEAEGQYVKVSVKNHGPVIPEDFRTQLFEPFLQAENSATRRRGGTGLGLSIVKRIVENSGGVIGFESCSEQGTTFWFTMPTEMPTEATDMFLSDVSLPNQLTCSPMSR